jgi:hypothetical protein
MIDLIMKEPVKVVTVTGFAIAAVLYGLHKLGWLSMEAKDGKWNGTERRECSQHPALNQKVCSLYVKLEEVDKKLDLVAERLQYVLGSLEGRWGKKT